MQEFLQALYEQAPEGYISVSIFKPRQTTRWVKATDIDELRKTCLKAAQKTDVYYGVGIRKEKLPKGRGKQEDVIGIPGLWMDIDIQNGAAHKKDTLPESPEEAITFLKELPCTPSAIINSGNGVHAYWLFNEPWYFDDAEERNKAAAVLHGWQNTVHEMAGRKNWELDSTHDLPRVLRVPGTLNHKTDPPKEVSVIELNDTRYDLDDIEPFLTEVKTNSMPDYKTPDEQDKHGDLQAVIDNCNFIRYCRDNSKTLSEPAWWAMITNLCRCKDGDKTIHEWSKVYPKYSPQETDERIQRADKETRPHTCGHIQNTLKFKGCPPGGCGKKSPAVFGYNPLTKAKLVLDTAMSMPPEELEFDDIYQEEVFGALALAKNHDIALYEKFVAHVTKNSKMKKSALKEGMKQWQKKQGRMRLVEPGEESKAHSTKDWLPDNCPMERLINPPGYNISYSGVVQVVTKKESETEDEAIGKRICYVPVIPVGRVKDTDTGDEKISIAYHRDREWHNITADRSEVYSRGGMVKLSNHGLPVSSESAGALIKYLEATEGVNLEILPVTKGLGRMGWINNSYKQFMPHHSGDIELTISPLDTGSSQMAKGINPAGSLENWIQTVYRPLYDHPLARLFIAASFASPLLRLAKLRSHILHTYGSSEGGKTASLHAALSVWGNPTSMSVSYNTTLVGLERTAAFLYELPLGLNERQAIGTGKYAQEKLEEFVYMLCEGKSRIRGTQQGGLQTMNKWNLFVLSTGEDSLADESSRQGISNRIIEIYGIPIPKIGTARGMYEATAMHHGTAGPVFIEGLIGSIKEGLDVREEFLEISEKCKDRIGSFPELPIVTQQGLAICCLAEVLAFQYLFGHSREQAENEALRGLEKLYSLIAEDNEIRPENESVRAYNYLIAWCRKHRHKFYNEDDMLQDEKNVEHYGRDDVSFKEETGRFIMINPSTFGQALKEGGFPLQRTKKDWLKLGMFKTRGNDGGYQYRDHMKRRWYVVRKGWEEGGNKEENPAPPEPF